VYSIAYEISNLPTTELVAPITRATFPGYAKVSGDPAMLREIFLKVTSVIAIAVVPAGVGISAMAELVVKLALGPKWLDAIPLMSVLAFYGAIQAVLSNMAAMLIALGQVRTMVIILVINVMLLLPALVFGAREGGALGAAIGTLLATMAMIPINVTLVLRTVNLKFRELGKCIWRPILAAAAMYGLVDLMVRVWQVDTYIGMVEKALVIVAMGAVVYATVILLLWRLVACPDSAEEYLLRKFHLERLLAACRIGLR
jgi:lipopolysaccharide exporter